jgi:hypothetical protein
VTIRAQDHDEATVHGVIAVLDAWVKLGGRLQYGTSDETSCFLMPDASEHSIWPAAIYPSGKFEIVFQYLKDRPPFDDLALRRELMDRLNAITGVDLPGGKLDLRPGLNLEPWPLASDGSFSSRH